jgi:hypothetical protein
LFEFGTCDIHTPARAGPVPAFELNRNPLNINRLLGQVGPIEGAMCPLPYTVSRAGDHSSRRSRTRYPSANERHGPVYANAPVIGARACVLKCRALVVAA